MLRRNCQTGPVDMKKLQFYICLIYLHAINIHNAAIRYFLVERYSESESQLGNSGSEDNCNFGNSNAMSSGNSKESTGKNHTSIQTGYSQNNGTLSNSDTNVQFTNGPMSNGNLEHVSTPAKDGHSNSKESNKNRSSTSAKKNSSNKRSRNR